MDPSAAAYITAYSITDLVSRDRINRALGYLRAHGLLPDDAAFLRAGQQPSASAPVTLKGLVGSVASGSPFLTSEGMNYESGYSIHSWPLTTPPVSFTFMADVRGLIGTAALPQNSYGCLAQFVNSGASEGWGQSGIAYGYGQITASGGATVVNSCVAGTYCVSANSNVSGTPASNLFDGASAYSAIAGFSWLDQANPQVEMMTDGVLNTRTTAGNLRQVLPLNKMYMPTMRHSNGNLGLYYAKVTVGSWVLYRRVITDAEKLIVAQGMRILDPRKISLCTMGDSLTENETNHPIVRSSWPINFGGASSWSKYLRVFNYAESGMASYDAATQYAKWARARPSAQAFSAGWLTMQYGTNDLLQGGNSATIFSRLIALAATAKSDGFKVCICTVPMKDSASLTPLWSASLYPELANLNVLLKNSLVSNPTVFDALCDYTLINQTEEKIPGFFVDDGVHLLEAANILLAERMAMTIDFGVGMPRCTSLPSITGTTTRACSTGIWQNILSGYAYQWYRDAVAIAGATASTRVLDGNDTGHRLWCRVVATNAAGSQSASSNATATV